MVAADEYLVAVGQVAEPVEEVDGFGLGSHHAEVARMYHHVGLRQIAEPVVAAMSVGKMQDFHTLAI